MGAMLVGGGPPLSDAGNGPTQPLTLYGSPWAAHSSMLTFPIRTLRSGRVKGIISLGVDSFSILFNHRSFQKPDVSPGFPQVF